MRQTRDSARQRSRRKLEFDPQKLQLPLLNKAVYMDMKHGKQSDIMEEQLKKLGARVEKFLSCEVNYVISSSGPLRADEKPNSKAENPNSPLNISSPFTCGPSSTGQPEPRTSVVSRGKALAQIACAKNKASTVVASAEKLGIKVISIEAACKWLEKEVRKLKSFKEKHTKENKGKQCEQKQKENIAKTKVLKGSFIKFEDSSRQYRPIKLEFEKWPKLNLSVPPGICPFGEPKAKVQNVTRNAQQPQVIADCRSVQVKHGPLVEAKIGEIRPAQKPIATEIVGVPITTTGDARHLLNCHLRKNLAVNKLQGYCDCCGMKFQNMNDHINGEEHRSFARQKSNYESLDALINQVPSTVSFLQSVLLKHCFQKQGDTSMSSCPVDNLVMPEPISPLTTETTNLPSPELITACMNMPNPSGAAISTTLMESITDTDLISRQERTPTKHDRMLDKRPQAVVIRRPFPSGMFTSPRRRQLTPSKKPWIHECSMVFRDSPIASLQPSFCSGSSITPFLSDSTLDTKYGNVKTSGNFSSRLDKIKPHFKSSSDVFGTIFNKNFPKIKSDHMLAGAIDLEGNSKTHLVDKNEKSVMQSCTARKSFNALQTFDKLQNEPIQSGNGRAAFKKDYLEHVGQEPGKNQSFDNSIEQSISMKNSKQLANSDIHTSGVTDALSNLDKPQLMPFTKNDKNFYTNDLNEMLNIPIEPQLHNILPVKFTKKKSQSSDEGLTVTNESQNISLTNFTKNDKDYQPNDLNKILNPDRLHNNSPKKSTKETQKSHISNTEIPHNLSPTKSNLHSYSSDLNEVLRINDLAYDMSPTKSIKNDQHLHTCDLNGVHNTQNSPHISSKSTKKDPHFHTNCENEVLDNIHDNILPTKSDPHYDTNVLSHQLASVVSLRDTNENVLLKKIESVDAKSSSYTHPCSLSNINTHEKEGGSPQIMNNFIVDQNKRTTSETSSPNFVSVAIPCINDNLQNIKLEDHDFESNGTSAVNINSISNMIPSNNLKHCGDKHSPVTEKSTLKLWKHCLNKIINWKTIAGCVENIQVDANAECDKERNCVSVPECNNLVEPWLNYKDSNEKESHQEPYFVQDSVTQSVLEMCDNKTTVTKLIENCSQENATVYENSDENINDQDNATVFENFDENIHSQDNATVFENFDENINNQDNATVYENCNANIHNHDIATVCENYEGIEQAVCSNNNNNNNNLQIVSENDSVLLITDSNETAFAIADACILNNSLHKQGLKNRILTTSPKGVDNDDQSSATIPVKHISSSISELSSFDNLYVHLQSSEQEVLEDNDMNNIEAEVSLDCMPGITLQQTMEAPSIVGDVGVHSTKEGSIHKSEDSPIHENEITNSLINSENVNSFHNQKGSFKLLPLDDSCSSSVENRDREMATQEESIIEKLIVVPNIADRVKRRNRVTCAQPTLDKEGKLESTKKRKKKRIGSKIKESKPALPGIEKIQRHSYLPAKDNNTLGIVPNIGNRVKRRRTCTFFNHEGQYANNGEGGEVENTQLKQVTPNSKKYENIDSALTGNKERPFKYDNIDLTKYLRVVLDKQNFMEMKAFLCKDIVESKIDVDKKLLSRSESIEKTDNEVTDSNSAVVIRRRKSGVYPTFQSHKRPDVDWGNLEKEKDLSSDQGSTDDRNACNETFLSFKHTVCESNKKCQAEENIKYMGQQSAQAHTEQVHLMDLRSLIATPLTAGNDDDDTESIIRSRRKKQNVSVTNSQTSNCDDSRTNLTLGVSCSPRLRLKIRREPDSNGFTSTLEEICCHQSPGIECTEREKHNGKPALKFFPNSIPEEHLNMNSTDNHFSHSPTITHSNTSHANTSYKQKRCNDNKTVHKSKKRRKLSENIEHSMKEHVDNVDADLDKNDSFLDECKFYELNKTLPKLQDCQISSMCHRPQSPCFSSPASNKHIKSITPKKHKTSDNSASQSQSPVFKLCRNSIKYKQESLTMNAFQYSKNCFSQEERDQSIHHKNMVDDSCFTKTDNGGNNNTEDVYHRSKRTFHQSILHSPCAKRVKLDSHKHLTSTIDGKQACSPFNNTNPACGVTSKCVSSEISHTDLGNMDLVFHADNGNIMKAESAIEMSDAWPEAVNLLSNDESTELYCDNSLIQIPSFSSPDKMTDSSWGDICDSYITTSISRNQSLEPAVLRDSPGSRNMRYATMSLCRIQLPINSSPTRKITSKKEPSTEHNTQDRENCKISSKDSTINVHESFPKKFKTSERTSDTHKEFNLGRQVDKAISINFKSPQRLHSPQNQWHSLKRHTHSSPDKYGNVQSCNHTRRLFSPVKKSL